jgi:hypothetical protein
MISIRWAVGKDDARLGDERSRTFLSSSARVLEGQDLGDQPVLRAISPALSRVSRLLPRRPGPDHLVTSPAWTVQSRRSPHDSKTL